MKLLSYRLGLTLSIIITLSLSAFAGDVNMANGEDIKEFDQLLEKNTNKPDIKKPKLDAVNNPRGQFNALPPGTARPPPGVGAAGPDGPPPGRPTAGPDQPPDLIGHPPPPQGQAPPPGPGPPH